MALLFGSAFFGAACEGNPQGFKVVEAATWQSAGEELTHRASDKRAVICSNCKQNQLAECGHWYMILDKMPHANKQAAWNAMDVYPEFRPDMLSVKLPPANAENRFEILRAPG